MVKEENAIVLDYLPEGKYTDFKRNPLVQGLGTAYFTLLELIPKEDVSFETFESIYVGKDDPEQNLVRDKIQLVKRTLRHKDLTHNASANLEKGIELVIDSKPDKYLGFYNKSGPLSLKIHQLELLPGIGKKHLTAILREREKGIFADFDDIEKRVDGLHNPKGKIIQRIISEMQGNEKYYLFSRKPFVPRPGQSNFRGGGFRNRRF